MSIEIYENRNWVFYHSSCGVSQVKLLSVNGLYTTSVCLGRLGWIWKTVKSFSGRRTALWFITLEQLDVSYTNATKDFALVGWCVAKQPFLFLFIYLFIYTESSIAVSLKSKGIPWPWTPRLSIQRWFNLDLMAIYLWIPRTNSHSILECYATGFHSQNFIRFVCSEFKHWCWSLALKYITVNVLCETDSGPLKWWGACAILVSLPTISLPFKTAITFVMVWDSPYDW